MAGKSKKGKAKPKGGSRGSAQENVIGGLPRHMLPPPLRVRQIQTMIMRFVATSALTDCEVSRQNMSTWLLSVAAETTSAQATYVFGATRFRCLEMWAANLSSPLSRINVRFGDDSTAPGSYSPQLEYVSYGNNTFPAHLKIFPPKNSLLLNNWMVAGGNDADLFDIIEAPIGTVIDVTFDYILADAGEQGSEASAEITLSGVTGSGMYATGIDGNVTLTDPVGWTGVNIASVPLRTPKVTPSFPAASEFGDLLAANEALVARFKSLEQNAGATAPKFSQRLSKLD